MEKKDQLHKVNQWKQFLNRLQMPENMPDYASQAYWDSRYEMEKDHYDWYVNFEQLKLYFSQFLTQQMEILELGSGNSNVLGMMHKAGFKKLIGSDFSWNVINNRKNEQRYLKRGIKWEILDLTKQWQLKKVDCIFEKAALDCLPSTTVESSLRLIHQALKHKGVFIHVSCMRPERRIKMLSDWDVKVYELPKIVIPMFQEIDKNSSYYLYVCFK